MQRTRASASSVPTIVASTVLARASRMDSQNEEVSCGMAFHCRYHCVVNPFQAKLIWGSPVVTLLKLYRTITAIGKTRYAMISQE